MNSTDSFPKHVLMTTDAVGGVWTYSIELCRALACGGTRVSLAVVGPAPSECQRQEALAVPGLKLCEANYGLEWEDDPWDDVDESEPWLVGLRDSEQPDVVHVNSYSQASFDWRAPVVCVAHSCVRSWWRAVKHEEAPPRYAEYTSRVRNGLAMADLVVSPTLSMLHAIEAEYGFNGRHCVIPNARDARLFRPGQKQNLVFTAGRLWDDAKNIQTLADAAPSISWPVHVAGQGNDNVSSTLRYLGPLSTADMSGWYARASIYALPAVYEPFGLSALEAALAGCALVLSDIPSLREVWGDAALFVPPRDTQALAEALERAIRSSELREDLALRSRFRARRYSPERMAAAYREAYASAERNYSSRRAVAA